MSRIIRSPLGSAPLGRALAVGALATVALTGCGDGDVPYRSDSYSGYGTITGTDGTGTDSTGTDSTDSDSTESDSDSTDTTYGDSTSGDSGYSEGDYGESAGSGSIGSSGVVPAELVGRWNGGSNHTGHWYYEFYPDGSYRAWPADDFSTVFDGTFEVVDDTITFSNAGSPVSSQWSVSDGLLFLDGFSYVPA